MGQLNKIFKNVFGISIQQSEENYSEEEILNAIDEAHEKGVIEENEAEMIQNIIRFNEKEADDIMTHRSNIVAFEKQTLLKEVVQTMLDEGFSRYPVYDTDLDNVLGIIYYKDIMKQVMSSNDWKEHPIEENPELIRPVNFIPESRAIDDLFRTMKLKQFHMAVIIDEYGQTAGLVTMEDILEEIVGDILDEYDEEETTISTQQDDSILIDGIALLEEVEEELQIDFHENEIETLNGFLTSQLGHIPTENDIGCKIPYSSYSFEILSVAHKVIERVRAVREETESGQA